MVKCNYSAGAALPGVLTQNAASSHGQKRFADGFLPVTVKAPSGYDKIYIEICVK